MSTLLLVVLGGLVPAAAYLWGIVPLGVAGEWTWGYRPLPGWLAFLPVVGFALLLAGYLWLADLLAGNGRAGVLRPDASSPERRSGSCHWLAVALLPIVGLLFQIALAFLNHNEEGSTGMYNVPVVILHGGTTGHFTQAGQIRSVSEFVDDYAAKLPTFKTHSHTHMPGAVLLFYVLRRSVEASPALQDLSHSVATALGVDLQSLVNPPLLMPPAAAAAFLCALVLMMLGCLGALPVYCLGRMLACPRIGLVAALLYLLLPSLGAFSPTLDQVYPLLSASAVLVAYQGWKRQRPVLLFAAGVVISVGIFVSFAFLTLLFVLAAMFALDTWREGMPNRRFLIWSAAAFLLGLASIQVLVYAAWDINVLEVFLESMRVNRDVYLERFQKTYWKWIGYNLYDFLSFCGFAVSGLFFAAVAQEMRNFGIRDRSSDVGTVALAFATTLLVLNFSGIVLGEAARVWIFLTPLVVVPAASFAVKRLGYRIAPGLATLLVVLQFVQAVVFKSRLEVLSVAAAG